MRLFPVAILLCATPALPLAADDAVSFRKEIAPLLQRRCATCHCEENSKGRYRLDTFQRLLESGDGDSNPVIAGKPEDSELYLRLVEPDPSERMPQKADALAPEEVALVEKWIKAGAPYDGEAPDQPLVQLARPALLRPAPARYARPAPVNALAFSPDGKLLAVGGYYEVTLWSLADGSLRKRIAGLPERITSLAWNSKSGLLAVAGGTPGQWGTVALVTPDAESPPQFLCDQTETALCVAFSPDGALLAAAGADRTVRWFDARSGREIRIVRQHADWVQSVAFSEDGGRLVTASRDRTSRIFDVRTGEVEASYAGSEQPLLESAFSSDGSHVFSLDREKTVQVWDIGSRQKTSEIKGLGGNARHTLFWNGLMAAAGGSPVITVRQTGGREELFALAGHRAAVNVLAVSPDKTVLASGGADGEVLLWSLACGTWTLRFVASPGW